MWRVLLEAERPDVVRGGGEGFHFATCGSCGRHTAVENVLVLVLDRGPERVLVARPEVLTPLMDDLKDVSDVFPPQVLASASPIPRWLLPVLLARDLDVDLAAPEAAAAEVGLTFGALARASYGWFLARAADRVERAADLALVETLFSVADGALGKWLVEHPRAHSEAARRTVAAVMAAAQAAGDLASAGSLELTLRLLGSAAGGENPREIETRFRSDLLAHSAETVEPVVRELWGRAEDPDAEVSVPALRKLLTGPGCRGPHGQERRTALNLLAAHLLARGDGTSVKEAVVLLEDVRATSPTRDVLWVQATGNLATVFGAHGRGDVIDDWATSVALLKEAAVSTAGDRRGRGIYLRNLGLALSGRPGGSTSQELDEALAHLTASLEGLTADDDLEDWAHSQVDLGLVHMRRGDAQAAADQYAAVVDKLGGTGHNRLLVFARLNLSGALLAGDPPDPAGALKASRPAVALAETLDDPETLSWAHRRLGDSLAAVAGRESAAALESWRRAVDVVDAATSPGRFLENATPLAHAYEQLGAWEDLAPLYATMLEAFYLQYDAQETTEGRGLVLSEYPRLSRWAAHALARAGRIAEAVDALEGGRALALGVSVGRASADLRALGKIDPFLADAYGTAVAGYAAAIAVRGGASALTAHRHLAATVAQIRATPGFDGFLARPRVPELLAHDGSDQVIYLTTAPPGTHAFRVALDDSGRPTYEARFFPVLNGAAVVGLAMIDPRDGSLGVLVTQAMDDPAALEGTLERATAMLGPVLETIAGWVAESGPTVLVAAGLIGLLPLQALRAAGRGTSLDDAGETHLSPSLAVHTASAARAARDVPPVLVAVADTDKNYPLPGSLAEVEALAGQPGWAEQRTAVGDLATLAWVVENAASASHLHFACHGSAGLVGAEGELTLADDSLSIDGLRLLGPLRARVVVASACQSGLFDTESVPDEFVGLDGGLLDAGAACAIVSLWPVGDDVTALLMTRFYELLDNDGPPSQQRAQAALRDARTWLRDLSGTERAAFLRDRPALADGLRRRGVLRTAPGAAGRPYASVVDYGAFVAYGC